MCRSTSERESVATKAPPMVGENTYRYGGVETDAEKQARDEARAIKVAQEGSFYANEAQAVSEAEAAGWGMESANVGEFPPGTKVYHCGSGTKYLVDANGDWIEYVSDEKAAELEAGGMERVDQTRPEGSYDFDAAEKDIAALNAEMRASDDGMPEANGVDLDFGPETGESLPDDEDDFVLTLQEVRVGNGENDAFFNDRALDEVEQAIAEGMPFLIVVFKDGGVVVSGNALQSEIRTAVEALLMTAPAIMDKSTGEPDDDQAF